MDGREFFLCPYQNRFPGRFLLLLTAFFFRGFHASRVLTSEAANSEGPGAACEKCGFVSKCELTCLEGFLRRVVKYND